MDTGQAQALRRAARLLRPDDSEGVALWDASVCGDTISPVRCHNEMHLCFPRVPREDATKRRLVIRVGDDDRDSLRSWGGLFDGR